MPQHPNLHKSRLNEIKVFLDKVDHTNESTEYASGQDYIVESIAELVKSRGKQKITDEFDTAYIHPMITVQKWVSELKLLADEALREISDNE